METKNSIILITMNIIYWVIFIGLCIRTGFLLISILNGLLGDSDGVRNLNLLFLEALVIVFTALKAYIAYLVIKISLKINYSKPFSQNIVSIMSKISYTALGTGILAMAMNAYAHWTEKRENIILQEWNGAEFLYLAGIIFVINLIFKKGIEAQNENELTV